MTSATWCGPPFANPWDVLGARVGKRWVFFGRLGFWEVELVARIVIFD